MTHHLRMLSAVVLLAGASAVSAVAQTEHQHESEPASASCEGVQPSRGCSVEDYLLSVLEHHGVEAAMAALDSLALADANLRRDAHQYAHSIGMSAYSGDEDVGRVFARCTPSYQSGCYHGVIQAYFSKHAQAGGLDTTFVNALCRGQREDADNRWLLFQCAHGMGHGMLTLAANHLPTALDGCDLVEDAWERESCYGGVFMENIVHVTMPHHAAGGAAAADRHADHADHLATAGAGPDEFPPLKRDEPLYPCTVLDGRYQPACYQMQTSAILHFNGQDVTATGRICETAPEAFRRTCFQSLGRDISSLTLQNNNRAIRLCATAPEEFEPWCHTGYAKNLVDVTADPADGFAYCRLLPPGESKRVCHIAVGEEIWVLAEAPERRAAKCLDAEPEFLAACRHGAGLSDDTGDASPTGSGGPARPGG